MKIFIGTHENCGIVSSLRNGFEILGHETTTWLKARDRLFPNEHYNFDFSKLALPRNNAEEIIYKLPFFNRVYNKLKEQYNNSIHVRSFKKLPEHDLYIYTWSTALPGMEDLRYLKSKGKKIIFLFIGSEARFAPAFNQEFPNTPITWSAYQLNESINKKLKFLRTIEETADFIFSLPDQSGLLVRPYLHMYMPLDVEKIKFNYPENEIPKIIHAPTNRAIKGTDKILAALEQLRSEGCKFDFKLIENQPNHVVKAELEKSDIVIDQIYAHGPGVLGSEAMAAGCAVATRYLRGYESVYAPPVCFIDSETLVENLRKLILDKAYRRDLVSRGREFVKQKNDPVSIAERILNLYKSEKINFDYVPEFFIKKFKLPGKSKISIRNLKRNKDNIERFYPGKIDWKDLKERGLV